MLSIFDYSDYRQFIKDYYAGHKTLNPSFSFRYLAQKAGINSAPFFKFIIEGKRNLTKATLLKTCVALKLNDREAEYFEDLVFFNQAKSVKEKNHFFAKLISQQKQKNVKKILEHQYAYFTEWYHCVLRELVCLKDFKNDYVKLAKTISPPITAKQAGDSIKLLLQLGLIKIVDGRYVQTDSVISTGNSIMAHQVINFQINMLHKAIEVFNRCAVDERLTSATTFSISAKTYALFVEKLRKMRSELLEMSRQDEAPDTIYELTMNLFPLSQSGVKL